MFKVFASSQAEHSPDRLGRIKVAVVGSPGVGKTVIAQLIAHGAATKSARPTVGCHVLLKLVHYPGGSTRSGSSGRTSSGLTLAPAQAQDVFVELWDVGAAERYACLRPLWWQGLSGVILVHDLSSSPTRSMPSVQRWAQEVARRGSGFVAPLPEERAALNVGCLPVPALVIGNKVDLLAKYRRRRSLHSWLHGLRWTLGRSLSAALQAALPRWVAASLRLTSDGAYSSSSSSSPGSLGRSLSRDAGMLVHGSLQASALEGELDMAAVNDFFFSLIKRRYFSAAAANGKGAAAGPAAGGQGLLPAERLPSVMWHTIAEGSEGSTPLSSRHTPAGQSESDLFGRHHHARSHSDTGRIDDLI